MEFFDVGSFGKAGELFLIGAIAGAVFQVLDTNVLIPAEIAVLYGNQSAAVAA